MIHTHRFFATGRRAAARPASLITAARLGRTALLALALALGGGFLAAGAGAQPPSANAVGARVGAAAGQAATVNINTADAAALAARLTGVGRSRAEEIVRHRETYGPFASVDELMEVKGIGESTLEKNRQRITLE